MYVKYVTSGTLNMSQISNDIAKLASGSEISTLSASCNKTDSQILHNDVAPGWTIVDAAGPVLSNGTGTVISAPDYANSYTKYVNIGGIAISSITMVTYQTYTVGTHTGTVPSTATTTQALTLTTNTIYYIYISPRTICIISPTQSIGTFEFSRDAIHLSNTSYQSHVVSHNLTYFNISALNTSGATYISRLKNVLTGVDVITNTGGLGGGHIFPMLSFAPTTATSSLPNTPIYDNSGNLYNIVTPCYMVYAPNANHCVMLGKFYDVQLITYNYGEIQDTVSDGTKTYVICGNGTGRFILPLE